RKRSSTPVASCRLPAMATAKSFKSTIPGIFQAEAAKGARGLGCAPRRALIGAVTTSDTHRAIHAAFRLESAKLIATLTRIVRDVGTGEELAQDALLAALEAWPKSGVPDNPGAWLMATAKNRALNGVRRAKMLERKHAELGRDVDADGHDSVSALEESIDDDIGDDLLR